MMNIDILKNIKTIIPIVLAVFLFSSCEEELNIKPDDFPPMLVLNGVVEQDSLFIINVSRTGGLNETFMLGDLFVTDATVNLYDGENFLEIMKHDSLGYYSSNHYAQGGHEYSIEVEKDDYPIATAYLDYSDEPSIEISKFSFESTDSLFTYDIPVPGGEILLKLFHVNYDLTLSDNGEKNNYYSFRAMTKYQYVIHNYGYEEEEENELVNLVYDDAGVGMLEWSDWEKYNEQYFGQGIMNDPGYAFRAIDDKIFNGNDETFDFMTSFWTSEIGDFSIVVKSYPESIVKYLESVELYQNAYDNPYSEPVNIYSNIENGIGFVCGIPCSKIEFDIE
jgi:hypothetical protein